MEFGEESCLAQSVRCACLEKDFRKKMGMVNERQYHIVCVCSMYTCTLHTHTHIYIHIYIYTYIYIYIMYTYTYLLT